MCAKKGKPLLAASVINDKATQCSSSKAVMRPNVMPGLAIPARQGKATAPLLLLLCAALLCVGEEAEAAFEAPAPELAAPHRALICLRRQDSCACRLSTHQTNDDKSNAGYNSQRTRAANGVDHSKKIIYERKKAAKKRVPDKEVGDKECVVV